MPYKNIVFVKLEKRLLNDHRWFGMTERAQLLYIKLMLGCTETYNKLPIDSLMLRQQLRISWRKEIFNSAIKEIQNNFPKFKKNGKFYYFEEFDTKTNYRQENPSDSEVVPKGATDIDKEKEEDKEKEKYGECVSLTKSEYEKLITKYGLGFTKRCIEKLDNYKGANGKKYKSDYRAILNWVVDGIKKDAPLSFNTNPLAGVK